jgi:hypothetical protein
VGGWSILRDGRQLDWKGIAAGSQRQRHRKAAALAFLAFDLQVTVMRLNQAVDVPQPNTLPMGAIGHVPAATEALEDVR